MQKIPLGTSGMYVSKVCLGTMTFGDQNNESEAFRLLDYAFDRGINFIDTAEIYPVKPQAATRGLSETIISGTKLDLRENIDAISISLSDEIIDHINEIHSLITNPGL